MGGRAGQAGGELFKGLGAVRSSRRSTKEGDPVPQSLLFL